MSNNNRKTGESLQDQLDAIKDKVSAGTEPTPKKEPISDESQEANSEKKDFTVLREQILAKDPQFFRDEKGAFLKFPEIEKRLTEFFIHSLKYNPKRAKKLVGFLLGEYWKNRRTLTQERQEQAKSSAGLGVDEEKARLAALEKQFQEMMQANNSALLELIANKILATEQSSSSKKGKKNKSDKSDDAWGAPVPKNVPKAEPQDWGDDAAPKMDKGDAPDDKPTWGDERKKTITNADIVEEANSLYPVAEEKDEIKGEIKRKKVERDVVEESKEELPVQFETEEGRIAMIAQINEREEKLLAFEGADELDGVRTAREGIKRVRGFLATVTDASLLSPEVVKSRLSEYAALIGTLDTLITTLESSGAATNEPLELDQDLLASVDAELTEQKQIQDQKVDLIRPEGYKEKKGADSPDAATSDDYKVDLVHKPGYKEKKDDPAEQKSELADVSLENITPETRKQFEVSQKQNEELRNSPVYQEARKNWEAARAESNAAQAQYQEMLEAHYASQGRWSKTKAWTLSALGFKAKELPSEILAQRQKSVDARHAYRNAARTLVGAKYNNPAFTTDRAKQIQERYKQMLVHKLLVGPLQEELLAQRKVFEQGGAKKEALEKVFSVLRDHKYKRYLATAAVYATVGALTGGFAAALFAGGAYGARLAAGAGGGALGGFIGATRTERARMSVKNTREGAQNNIFNSGIDADFAELEQDLKEGYERYDQRKRRTKVWAIGGGLLAGSVAGAADAYVSPTDVITSDTPVEVETKPETTPAVTEAPVETKPTVETPTEPHPDLQYPQAHQEVPTHADVLLPLAPVGDAEGVAAVEAAEMSVPYDVKPGDNLWNIIETRYASLLAEIPPAKHDAFIDSVLDRLQADVELQKELGLPNPGTDQANIDLIHAGQKLDVSKLDELAEAAKVQYQFGEGTAPLPQAHQEVPTHADVLLPLAPAEHISVETDPTPIPNATTIETLNPEATAGATAAGVGAAGFTALRGSRAGVGGESVAATPAANGAEQGPATKVSEKDRQAFVKKVQGSDGFLGLFTSGRDMFKDMKNMPLKEMLALGEQGPEAIAAAADPDKWDAWSQALADMQAAGTRIDPQMTLGEIVDAHLARQAAQKQAA